MMDTQKEPTINELLVRMNADFALLTKLVLANDGVVTADPDIFVPDKSKPVFGHPRTLVGYRDQNRVYRGTGIDFLLEVFNGEGEPDAILFRGCNLEYKSVPGVARPVGVESGNSGTQAPKGSTRPTGYRIDYFDGDKALYYQQSDKPDRLPESVKAQLVKPSPWSFDKEAQ